MTEEHSRWLQLTSEISLDVWKIDCAEMFITDTQAESYWNAMPRTGSNPRIQIERIVGSALIALGKRGLLAT